MPALSLKWRLLVIIVGITGAALLVSGVSFLQASRERARSTLLDSLRGTTDVVAQSASAAVAFGDQTAAAGVLASLTADPRIVGATITDRDGRRFARWARPGAVLPEAPPLSLQDHTFLPGALVVSRPIAASGDPLGTLVIVADLAQWQGLVGQQVRNATLLLLVLFFVAGATAWWLQGYITRPIDRLLDTIGAVTRTKNFSLRAGGGADDEFGRLVAGFNAMLDEVEARDARLGAAHAELQRNLGELAREVGERRRAELEVHELNEALERRVAERTQQLETANAELEAFSYSVSHDLRAPLRAIHGFSDALAEDYGPQLDDEARDHLARIRRGARNMSQLIDDLLNLSRVSRAEIRLKEVDLSLLSEQIVAELRAAEPSREVELRVAPELKVRADPGLMAIAWRNLLNNAWKFSRDRRPAHIEVGRFRSPDGEVYFVRDDGAGFDMAFADKLFGAFQRLHRGDEFAGTGIGLAIVRRVITRHGGRVWAEGRPGAGASLYISLPATEMPT